MSVEVRKVTKYTVPVTLDVEVVLEDEPHTEDAARRVVGDALGLQVVGLACGGTRNRPLYVFDAKWRQLGEAKAAGDSNSAGGEA